MSCLDAIGIDTRCQLVAMTHGAVFLTRTPDGQHELWLYDSRRAVGAPAAMRELFAEYLAGHWLERFFRS